MLDGIPMLSGESGDIKWDALPINHIKQVEIVKNAGSALYGSNAIGGIVNIITDDIAKNRYSADLTLGIYDEPYYPEWRWSNKTRIFHSASGEISHLFNKWALTARISEKQSDSYRQLDQFSRFDSFIKAKYRADDNNDLAITANVAYEDRGRYLSWLDIEHALEVDSLELNDRVYSSKIFISAIYNSRKPARKYSSTLKSYIFFTDWNDRSFNSDDNRYERSFSKSSKSGLEYSFNLAHIDRHFFTAGAESYLATVNSTFFDNRLGLGGAIFAQDEISILEPLTCSVGGRLDYFNVEDANQYLQFSPKLGMVVRMKDNIALRSSIGTGYRTPSMAELFSDLTVAGLLRILPNPDLKAEKSITTEIGGNIITTYGIFDIAVFSSWYDDFIEPKSIEESESEYKFQNIEDARVYGTELSFSLYHRIIDFSASYQYTRSEDLKLNEKLPYRPEHIASLSANLKYYKNFSFNAGYRYKSEKDFILQPTKGYSPSVSEKVLDIGHNVNFGRYYINIKVNNVLQYHYSEVQYGIEPIRHYVISTGVRF